MSDTQNQPRFREIQYNKIDVQPISHSTMKELFDSLEKPSYTPTFEKNHEKQLKERVYLFKVIYDGQSWEIRRTINQFKKLEHDIAQKKQISSDLEKNDPKITLIQLHKFLKLITNNEIIPQCVLTFLEISCINLPFKAKEGFMELNLFGKQRLFNPIQTLTQSKKKYFIITQQSLLYVKGPEKKKLIIEACLSFSYLMAFCVLDVILLGTIILISLPQMRLYLTSEHITDLLDFAYSLSKQIQESPYTKLHRFQSFSPIRTSECKWYIDGNKYFEDVCDAILQAKETIYITDWWLSPELYLKRPVDLRTYAQESEFLHTRLDNILKMAADKGVQILVLLYNCLTFILPNDPQHSKIQLESMSPNIRVLKHPKVPRSSSHHEKMVVIDQKIGFMGGLDLCFGRWDNQKHPLFEVHPFEQLWPQIDFSNSRVRDFYEVKKYQQTLLKENEPRMPWHDIAIQIKGDSVIDLSRHFAEYWNHVILSQEDYKKYHLLHANDLKMEGFVVSNTQNVVQAGREESNIQMKQNIFVDEIQTYQDQIEMNQTAQLNDTQSEQQFCEQSFIQQQQKEFEICQKNQKIFMETQDEIEDEEDDQYILESEYNKKEKKSHSQCNKSSSKVEKMPEEVNGQIEIKYFIPHIEIKQNQQRCITQLTRSSGTWSNGIIQTERSIQSAYLSLIQKAKHFIYIENQFFISNTAGNSVRNLVAQALISRIKEAHEKQQRFKVIVFLPLLPGFQESETALVNIILHFEYQTICRGGKSIIESLQSDGINPENYIQFFSLRQHELSPYPNSVPVTEMIYIHSKLMIIDDDIALIGSANINDRSLLGTRDSELAIIVEDQVKVNAIMDGKPYKTSKFAHTLRTELYMEHFDMPYEKVIDPLSLQFEKESTAQASINTRVYKEIFACIPDDDIKKQKDIETFRATKRLEEYEKLKQYIKGHAVTFPLNYLCDENLKTKVTQKAYYIPEKSFT